MSIVLSSKTIFIKPVKNVKQKYNSEQSIKCVLHSSNYNWTLRTNCNNCTVVSNTVLYLRRWIYLSKRELYYEILVGYF